MFSCIYVYSPIMLASEPPTQAHKRGMLIYMYLHTHTHIHIYMYIYICINVYI